MSTPDRSVLPFPDEVMLRIVLHVDKRTLLNLRLASHTCNNVVRDTPLGIAWEYARRLAEMSEKRNRYGLTFNQPCHSSVNMGGTILNILYSDHQKKGLKRRKVERFGIFRRPLSFPSWMKVELHKQIAAKRIVQEFESEIMDEVVAHAEKVHYVKLYSPAPSKPGFLLSQFVIPVEKLHDVALYGIESDMVITCEWDARSISFGIGNFHQFEVVAFSVGFSFGSYGPPDFPLFSYNDNHNEEGPDFDVEADNIKILWELLGVQELGKCEIMRLFNILAVGGYVEEDISFTWCLREDIMDELELA
eukprot:Phypoly_transcript_11223.p1 GENE.Phypoly_transcript_11223~~Phypoly_transcript_11223.p1  ORF type:complete len:340 (+),score=43.15 Phypoly_transcript_11223:106-1020(+)